MRKLASVILSAAAAAVLMPSPIMARDYDHDWDRDRDRHSRHHGSHHRHHDYHRYHSGRGHQYRHYYSPNSHGIRASVQRELRQRGYYHGPVDGVLGPSSRHAIRRYQDRKGLEVTGGINSQLLRSLGLR